MSFKKFEFTPQIQAGISACGYRRPTPIQDAAIPPVLEGRDVLGLAQTGTGKTAAFVLPLLQRLNQGPRKQNRVLILAPTRELALQIHENIETLGQDTGLRSVAVFGGVGKRPQITKIRSGAEFIVACPGRLMDLLREKVMTLDDIEILVLDEADQMFDKGFLPDIRKITALLPEKRQSLVFSAIMPKEIRKLTRNLLKNPATAQIANTRSVEEISHAMIQVKQEQKTALLKTLVQDPEMTSTLVFTRTRHKARKLAHQLTRAGFKSACIQGNLSQLQRQKALKGFKDGSFTILVATDVAARGLDITGISHVVNYDVPDTAEAYIHRTGRTGRAKAVGQALSFVTEKDTKIIRLIERNMGQKIQKADAPVMDTQIPEPVAPAPPEKEAAAQEEAPARTRRRRPRRRPKKKTSSQAKPAATGKTPSKKNQAKAKASTTPAKRKAKAESARSNAQAKAKAKADKTPKAKDPRPKKKKAPATQADAAPKKKDPKAKAKAKPKGQKQKPARKPRGRRDACPMPLAILGNKIKNPDIK